METEKIERCGFCGSYFRGETYMTADELNTTDPKLLEKAPAGYCANAQAETYGNQDGPRYVTRDMAIDAGDLSLEGSIY